MISKKNCDSTIFEQYKNVVDRYVSKDTREINFQNRVVLPLIDYILKDYTDVSVEDVSTQYRNRKSDIHKRDNYAGTHTPDLLIVRDWNYANINKPATDYIALIEVKSPALAPINRSAKHTEEEVREYCDICDHVILTDCYRWTFFYKGFDKQKTFNLFEDGKWCSDKEWEILLAYFEKILPHK
jgi:hypothetical protein